MDAETLPQRALGPVSWHAVRAPAASASAERVGAARTPCAGGHLARGGTSRLFLQLSQRTSATASLRTCAGAHVTPPAPGHPLPPQWHGEPTTSGARPAAGRSSHRNSSVRFRSPASTRLSAIRGARGWRPLRHSSTAKRSVSCHSGLARGASDACCGGEHALRLTAALVIASAGIR